MDSRLDLLSRLLRGRHGTHGICQASPFRRAPALHFGILWFLGTLDVLCTRCKSPPFLFAAFRLERHIFLADHTDSFTAPYLP